VVNGLLFDLIEGLELVVVHLLIDHIEDFVQFEFTISVPVSLIRHRVDG
jgi:hypothetical protein